MTNNDPNTSIALDDFTNLVQDEYDKQCATFMEQYVDGCVELFTGETLDAYVSRMWAEAAEFLNAELNHGAEIIKTLSTTAATPTMSACFLQDVKKPAEFTVVTVDSVLADIKNGKYRSQIEGLPNPQTDAGKYRAAKLTLPAIAFNGTFEGRITNDRFAESNGLCIVDIDHRTDIEADRAAIIANIPSTYAVWLSPSRNGLKVLIRIPDDLIHNDAEHKLLFVQITEMFSAIDIGIDQSGKDVRRVCFVSYDENIYINRDAVCMAVMPLEIKPNAAQIQQQPKPALVDPSVQDTLIQRCLALMEAGRGASYHVARFNAGRLAGGFIAGNQIDEKAAVDALIECSNAISDEYTDDDLTRQRELKALMDGLADGKLEPIHGIDEFFEKGEPLSEEEKARYRELAAEDAQAGEPKDWPEPGFIETKLAPVQPLSDDLVPDVLRNWLGPLTWGMQTAPDFSVMASLVCISSVIGSGCGIYPKAADTSWEVIPNLWGACIGGPSTMKTPSMKAVVSLLDRLQAKYGKQFESDKIFAEFTQKELDTRIKDVEKRLADLVKGMNSPSSMTTSNSVLSEDYAEKRAVLVAEYEVLKSNRKDAEPALRLLKTNEVSVQSMTKIQSENPRGVLMFRDEIVGLLAKWDRDDGADERAYFLEGWNGNGSYTDFKIDRGLTEAGNICISLLGGIQPDKLKKYLYQTTRGNNDGLVQRLQLAVWPDELPDWDYIDKASDRDAAQRVYSIIETLAEMDFEQYGAVMDGDRPYFHFDDEGQAVFKNWMIDLKNRAKREDNQFMKEHLEKYPSLVPSLALIFHLIDVAEGKAAGPVAGQTVRLAIRWCEYLESHARRIYAVAGDPVQIVVRLLADKIEEGAVPSPFKARDLYRKGWAGISESKDVDEACDVLASKGWLRSVKIPIGKNGGRKPSPEYSINPALIK